MSVLANGSPAEDFSVGKGLRQGDPLSPFLFLIVAEGLMGLMCKAVDNNLFHGYKVSNNIQFHTLQFADDTIIVGEGNWNNLWTIKTVLRSFEIVSGLKVNFYKSKIYGINLDDSFLRAASSFLNCAVEEIPFCFLGIPVGVNPRRRATWTPILDSMRKKLSSWNGRHLSIGGRVTLINSVLSCLPLYIFSFYKAPLCVIKDLVSIQRNFLWGGGLESSKMCWVSWDRICQSKEKGGLGIKDLEIFYSSLLCKWKWRCLTDSEAPWYGLLRYRYGSLEANFLSGEGRDGIKQASIWWRDIWRLGGEEDGNWFSNNISSNFGDGNDIAFWNEKWIDTAPLRVLFSSLYTKTAYPHGLISNMGSWEHDMWKWELEWNSEITDNELADAQDLLLILEHVRPRRESSDKCRWKAHVAGIFTVKTTYMELMSRRGATELETNTVKALKNLWLNNVPSKVTNASIFIISFGWQQLGAYGTSATTFFLEENLFTYLP
ncbi:hypothetical protein TSUD_280390 [Trifolium subterraneum]|uniref:Reverse transcriptase domain-containing protein n=1 Tax=Trifolium subterraneum TaxID=3900 RepID=A0A2Z6NK10_TRISU|nr:hypothetical protein TSUD_280390 [Trifolium subterraneum]